MTQLTLSILLTYGSFEPRGMSAKAQKSKLSIKKTSGPHSTQTDISGWSVPSFLHN